MFVKIFQLFKTISTMQGRLPLSSKRHCFLFVVFKVVVGLSTALDSIQYPQTPKGCPKKKTGQKWILDFEHEGLVSGGCPFYSLVYS